VLAQLRAIAEEIRASVVNISHLNKAPTTDAYLRIGGSPAFWNASRSVVLVTEDETDPDVVRLVAQRKANLARIVPVERWRVEEVVHSTDRFGDEVRVPVLRFVEIATDVDRNDVLGPKTPTKRESAEVWLAGTLSDCEWHDVTPIKDAGRTLGYSESTLDRAADELGVEKRKTDTFPSRSQWRLITHSSAPTLVKAYPES
jgi:hypothetical protein